MGEGNYAPVSTFGIYAIAIPKVHFRPDPGRHSSCIDVMMAFTAQTVFLHLLLYPLVFTAPSSVSSNIHPSLVSQPNSTFIVSNPVNQSSSLTDL